MEVEQEDKVIDSMGVIRDELADALREISENSPGYKPLKRMLRAAQEFRSLTEDDPSAWWSALQEVRREFGAGIRELCAAFDVDPSAFPGLEGGLEIHIPPP